MTSTVSKTIRNLSSLFFFAALLFTFQSKVGAVVCNPDGTASLGGTTCAGPSATECETNCGNTAGDECEGACEYCSLIWNDDWDYDQSDCSDIGGGVYQGGVKCKCVLEPR